VDLLNLEPTWASSSRRRASIALTRPTREKSCSLNSYILDPKPYLGQQLQAACQHRIDAPHATEVLLRLQLRLAHAQPQQVPRRHIPESHALHNALLFEGLSEPIEPSCASPMPSRSRYRADTSLKCQQSS
jgi:hypothetical protein